MKRFLLRLWNLWLPFLGAGIRIRSVDPSYRHMIVELKRRLWTANYVGTQYGGSIYSMTDPFYMIMLMQNLGPGYVVWDKAASIRFLRPGRTRLTAEFTLDDTDLAGIRETVEKDGKTDWLRRVQVKDADGMVVAEVQKTIYIRKKQSKT